MDEINCSYFQLGACKICTGLTLSYPMQVSKKCDHLKQSLSLDKLDQIQNSNAFGFRDKAKIQVSGSLDQPILGFLNPQTLQVENEILACPLHNQFINDLLPKIKALITQYKLRPYDIHSRSGELKGIILFYSPTTGQSYLRWVVRSKESLDRLKKCVLDLPELTAISANIQPAHAAILEGKEEIYFKEDHIIHQFNQKKMLISPQGFVQTNTQVAAALYATAKDWVEKLNISRCMDFYCGQGAFSFHLEDVCENVFGVEVNQRAIEMANLSKQLYQYRTHFMAAPAHSMHKQIGVINPDLVLVNPPRAGLRDFTHVINNYLPAYLLYSSCNVETLKIDLDILCKNYGVIKTGLFDMFPQSDHYEALVLLEKLKA